MSDAPTHRPERVAHYPRPAAGGSFYEWKGMARYFDVMAPDGLALERVGSPFARLPPRLAS